MVPYYKEGDYVLLITAFYFPFLKEQKDIVFKTENQITMIKRILSLDKRTKTLKVYGTGPDSISSNDMGEIQINKLLGLVVYKF